MLNFDTKQISCMMLWFSEQENSRKNMKQKKSSNPEPHIHIYISRTIHTYVGFDRREERKITTDSDTFSY